MWNVTEGIRRIGGVLPLGNSRNDSKLAGMVDSCMLAVGFSFRNPTKLDYSESESSEYVEIMKVDIVKELDGCHRHSEDDETDGSRPE